MDELISKRAVIEAIEKARANVGHNLERSIGKSIIEILDEVGRDVNRLQHAQPEPIRINLNEPIKVKLTDWGKEIYYHQYDRVNQCSIEGGFDTQKWAESVVEMMEEKWRKERTPSSSKVKK